MIVPITFDSSSSNPKLPSGLARISHDEVVLVELQGSLDVECNDPSERNGKLVGKLRIDSTTVCARESRALIHALFWHVTPKNKPTLIIGHHLLEGKISTLPKPFAILHRTNTNVDGLDEAMDCDRPSVNQTSWDVVGIVKKKIAFSKRPMPIVSKG